MNHALEGLRNKKALKFHNKLQQAISNIDVPLIIEILQGAGNVDLQNFVGKENIYPRRITVYQDASFSKEWIVLLINVDRHSYEEVAFLHIVGPKGVKETHKFEKYNETWYDGSMYQHFGE